MPHSFAPHQRPPLTRADFPVSGENVRKADERGAGPAGLSPKVNRGEKTTPQSKIKDFVQLP